MQILIVTALAIMAVWLAYAALLRRSIPTVHFPTEPKHYPAPYVNRNQLSSPIRRLGVPTHLKMALIFMYVTAVIGSIFYQNQLRYEAIWPSVEQYPELLSLYALYAGVTIALAALWWFIADPLIVYYFERKILTHFVESGDPNAFVVLREAYPLNRVTRAAVRREIRTVYHSETLQNRTAKVNALLRLLPTAERRRLKAELRALKGM